MKRFFSIANKIQKYYWLSLLGENDLEFLYKHYVLNEPKELVIAEDPYAKEIFDLVTGEISLSDVLGYDIGENDLIAMHEEIKSGICYTISMLAAAYSEEETGAVSVLAIERPMLYNLAKNLNKLP